MDELQFRAGDEQSSFTFTSIDDSIVENSELFVVSFDTSDPAATLPIDTISITIVDNGDCKDDCTMA